MSVTCKQYKQYSRSSLPFFLTVRNLVEKFCKPVMIGSVKTAADVRTMQELDYRKKYENGNEIKLSPQHNILWLMDLPIQYEHNYTLYRNAHK